MSLQDWYGIQSSISLLLGDTALAMFNKPSRKFICFLAIQHLLKSPRTKTLLLLVTFHPNLPLLSQKIGLQIKATLDNVTNLTPDGQDFRWYVKNVGWDGSYFGEVRMSCNWKKDQVFQLWGSDTIMELYHIRDILSDTIKPYNADDSDHFKTVIAFECRGIEPVEFSPRVGYTCSGVDSPSKFEVDLREKEWVDYDENTNVSVGIFDFESKFITLPSKK